MIWLQQGDCLELMKNIPDGSVDLVLTDPPYGTIKGIEKSKASKDCGYRACDWDEVIPTDKMFAELSRVLRPNGKAVLFAQEPYTSTLVKSAIPSLPFLYRAIWYKNTAGNILGAKSAMVNRFEDICVFGSIYRKSHYQADHPLREYFKAEKEKSGLTNKQINKILGNGMASHYFTNGEQFLCPTEQMYGKLQTTGFFKRPYEEIKEIDAMYVQDIYRKMNVENPQVFNLWQGGKSKSNVLEYKKDNDGYHPTQKPVALLEDLIQTYSNEGDIVLDFTMGSGSTGVACVNLKRNFIGIELEEEYFKIAEERINNARLNKQAGGD